MAGGWAVLPGAHPCSRLCKDTHPHLTPPLPSPDTTTGPVRGAGRGAGGGAAPAGAHQRAAGAPRAGACQGRAQCACSGGGGSSGGACQWWGVGPGVCMATRGARCLLLNPAPPPCTPSTLPPQGLRTFEQVDEVEALQEGRRKKGARAQQGGVQSRVAAACIEAAGSDQAAEAFPPAGACPPCLPAAELQQQQQALSIRNRVNKPQVRGRLVRSSAVYMVVAAPALARPAHSHSAPLPSAPHHPHLAARWTRAR